MASEQLEEYLESILDIEEKEGVAKTSAIAKCMKVAPASVTGALQALADKGFIEYQPYKGATLTGQGREMARKVKRRHRLLEVFLTDVLHISTKNVHDEACKMEHTLSDETECALCKMLNAPSRCPHGSLIGACNRDVESCSACLEENAPPSTTPRDEPLVPVTSIQPGQKATIAFIRGDSSVVQRLADLGLTLRAEIQLIRKAPLSGPIEIGVRKTRLAIDRAIADHIFVSVCREKAS
ncbi:MULTISPECIES: metal-dependent transcriptional regulator [unclassified Methanoregula]|uniref:metal-dependent transcriptional regulator n=1 Tax=unclassified Methanoregula TaxID=2649730 RepID=UPI0009C70855|nr:MULTISPECIES: metal-dependent transcriptional regulator [unclassified Methanoregula]OPX64943.1 MAG: manganese transport regulator MntR [Methanoregula sp. PtaB.Bin085]OPY32995.1 MAG: manganese transport regulator MntR [Methanoregula sp. PtaU1.Bin006]